MELTETQARDDSKENAIGVKKWDMEQATAAIIQHISEAKARTTLIRLKKMTLSDMTNLKKKHTWEHSMYCALEDVEESKNDARKNTTVSASELTPVIMMKQCEEIMDNVKDSAKHRNKAHEQS